MIAVGMMQVAIDEIIDVIAVRHGFMTVSRPMHVAGRMPAARMPRCAGIGVLRRHLDRVLIDVSGVHVMQMAVMKIIDMIAVLDRCMSAPGTMPMGVVVMMGQFAVGHGSSPSLQASVYAICSGSSATYRPAA
jgi:hypothetical protein